MMNNPIITLSESQSFTTLMVDYLSKNENVEPFYQAYPNEENLLKQAEKKLRSYSRRELLVERLQAQYSEISLTQKQRENIELLKNSHTLTITTGHQLNLLTGPVFFFYKILQTIKMCASLNESQKKYSFVPIFWMATEDHDFEEINHFNFQNRKFIWEHPHGGAVGRLSLEGIEEVVDAFLNFFPESERKKELKKIIDKSYCSAKNLSQATRIFVQELLGEYGILCLDGDDARLKKEMIPIFEKELIEQSSQTKIQEQSAALHDLGYTIQVYPRPINLFYLHGSKRERIVEEEGRFMVLNTNLSFYRKEIIDELYAYPEKFSPNVVLRPVYQEVILPNVAYIGGGGELAYWLQLKSNFVELDVDFPLLFLRNSLLFLSEKQHSKQLRLQLSNQELFYPIHELVREKVRQESTVYHTILPYENRLIDLFDELEKLAEQTNPTFSDMLQAQRSKQLKGFDKLKKRMMKAEIKEHQALSNRIKKLKNELFPQGELQERHVNFSDFWLDYGKDWLNDVYDAISPFTFGFIIKTLSDDRK
ncbi:bacillithiol biosynthesis cysteine-adding enzyme BshC [Weeksella virosa]|nr:bacillithiol biosynthesis cysteine-adding enzyme BshC [Weeksella virosa]